MSIVKFSRLISCSSEDPKHPASNLLDSQVGKCWKCKTAGEKQSIVILELERSCRIHSIDIGNENSAFIEIFVGKSAVPDQYEILRVASLLMSTVEAKKGENRNGVRFFKKDDFSKPAADESWDRIKITCTQPFNKLIQYGLSFIKVRSKDVVENDTIASQNSLNVSSPSQTPSLGKFKLKQESKGSNEVCIGSFFARRNDLKDEAPITAAAAIRAASANTEPSLKRLSDLLPGLKDTKKARQNDAEISIKADERRTATGRLLYEETASDEEAESKTPFRAPRKKLGADEGPLIYKELSDEETQADKPSRLTRNPAPKKNVQGNSTLNSRGKKSPTKKQISAVSRKPFNRLLEGVVFVISGYQNPYRSEIRSKALSMGAKYKADWDPSCTHLICAFPNTPKANVVRGKGWILRKEWIEDCYSQRKRLRSQTYRMDKTDNFVYGNDEEIHEEIPDQMPTTSKVNTRRSSTEATCSSRIKNSTQNDGTEEENIYEAETDIDSDEDSRPSSLNPDYEAVDLEVLPDFLADKKIYIGADLSKKITNMLERYVIAFKGEVVTDIDTTDYIISEDDRYKENTANSPVVLPDWLWECADQRQLVSIQNYLLDS